jgi:hypothetical protein
VTDERSFEISRAVKDKGKRTVQYEVLDGSRNVKDTLTNWEVLFLQFRDQSGKSAITSTHPSTLSSVNGYPHLRVPMYTKKTMFILSSWLDM